VARLKTLGCFAKFEYLIFNILKKIFNQKAGFTLFHIFRGFSPFGSYVENIYSMTQH
jgi:hypothetical protein